jgi:tetraacyldisaccharide 4'-kinase
VDLVLIDATNPFGYGRLLPRGLLREPVESLRRADLILLTRTNAVSPERKRLTVEAIRAVAPGPPVVEIDFPATGIANASGERRPVEHLEETPLLAFCGIGNPDGFAATLAAAGLRPTELIPFPDHHHYGPADLNRLRRRADAYGVAAAVTTLKDLVKIRSDALQGPPPLPLWAVETGCEIAANAPALYGRLDELIGRTVARRAA